MPTHRRRRWQQRCFGHQQGLRHCIGSLNIPSSCMQQPHFPPPPMWDDYESPCASDGGSCKRDRSTSCRVDRSTSYRRPPSFRYERHPKCRRRPSHPHSKHRYRMCLPTEPLYCDEYGQPCRSRRDCQEYSPPCYPSQEPPPPCYPQEAPCYVPKATSPCYPPIQPCNIPQPCNLPQPCNVSQPCYPPQPQQQQPCFQPETIPLPQCYMQQPMPQCYTQEPPCFSDDEMYPCPPMSECVQTIVSLPPCFFRKIGPCQDHEPLCRFLSPTCSKPVSICTQPPVPCAAPLPPQPCPAQPMPCPGQPMPCPPGQPVCPNLTASVQCLPPRHDSGTVCERRNVSFGCLENASPPPCMGPPCEHFSKKSQAELPDEEFNDDELHQHRKSSISDMLHHHHGKKSETHLHKKSSQKVICECSTSVSSLKKHKKDKDKDKKKKDKAVCDCMNCPCVDEKLRQLCTCMCSDSDKFLCECSKGSGKKIKKKSSAANQITCECYDVALDPIIGNFVVEKAVGMSRDSLARKKSSHRGDGCHCKSSASKNSVGRCSCHYPPAFEQLSCAGNIAGSCCCKDS